MSIRARRIGRPHRWSAALILAALGVATTGAAAPAADHAANVDQVTIGYSAWPGWFPLAVAQQEGIFKKDGLDVNLKYFADYVSSLDAMSAGKLDANSQTLNDTMAAVAGGSEQAIIVVNDNSAGNDAIICDEAITSVADMKGKTVAAEKGFVDIIKDIFKLTPAEARVLLTVVEFGGVSETARNLDVAESTVKTHLGRIFTKTETKRQADLVKLVAAFSSPARG